MKIKNLLTRETAETGLTAKGRAGNKFCLTRFVNGFGKEVYRLENTPRGQRIYIERYLFDRFRSSLKMLITDEKELKDNTELDLKIHFEEDCFFRVKKDKLRAEWICIHDLKPRIDSTSILELSISSLTSLVDLLYNEKLAHPSDVLDRIISYHQLFQFSFVDSGKSMNSNFVTRKNLLYTVEKFTPTLDKMNDWDSNLKEDNEPGVRRQSKNDENMDFVSKLGEKVQRKAYQIDYEALFKKNKLDSVENMTISHKSKANKKTKDYFSLPIMAQVIKEFKKTPFVCELSGDERIEFEKTFPLQKKGSFYIGLEIIDAVFKKNSAIKTFKFPLYYLKVDIVESGRTLYLEPASDHKIFLNHLALANLVNEFGIRKGEGDPVDIFFQKLSTQVFEKESRFDRICLFRQLPYDEDVFRKTRQILFGEAKSDDDQGLLKDLKILGVEVDLESTLLYKVEDNESLVAQYLRKDLSYTKSMANDSPEKFYQTLLGKFLVPEMAQKNQFEKFCDYPMIPGRLTFSMGSLLEQLNEHEILLLEGPPGTGKTFSILNLLIHCICTDKKVLIVSDNIGAIEALTEKIQEYLLGDDRKSAKSKRLDTLWKNAIKVVDEVPFNEKLASWSQKLKKMIITEDTIVSTEEVKKENFKSEIKNIDLEIKSLTKKIQKIMELRLAGEKSKNEVVAKKNFHATTEKHMNGFLSILESLVDGSQDELDKLTTFLKNRNFWLDKKWDDVFASFTIPQDRSAWDTHLRKLSRLEQVFLGIQEQMPRDLAGLKEILKKEKEHPLLNRFEIEWAKHFSAYDTDLKKTLKGGLSYLYHPLKGLLSKIIENIHFEVSYLRESGAFSLSRTLLLLHQSLDENEKNLTLDFEIYRHFKDDKKRAQSKETIQSLLEQIGKLQSRRDEVIKECFINRLEFLEYKLTKIPSKGVTPPLTRVNALLQNLEKEDGLDTAWPIVKDLQNILFDSFPFWICKKQAVPFLFPPEGKQFDLVIVDEATQCRVDDALSLFMRGDRLMAVGDDKQTVLAKNSVLDDYLFNEFELDEHLRFQQGSAIKGGGSHLFSLVKNIKKTSVMLNEHYRCPVGVIEFSNKYVYDSKLSTMQWSDAKTKSVIVDYSESKAPPSVRAKSGAYKGLETQMIDRFFDYMIKEIHQIEKRLKRKINVETEVAICYFLLKNEPYFEDKKSAFLAKLDRGNDILHGAGAKLQGKERDYIFYFWDVYRGNIAAFAQGDDELKRKGELNVLMSRPKKIAFHYLHGSFESLKHEKCTITDYLWKAYQKQSLGGEKRSFVKRTIEPGGDFTPWGRTSGELIKRIAMIFLEKESAFRFQNSVTVGDPSFRVDLLAKPKNSKEAFGLVDLSGFPYEADTAKAIVDYYFQLKRSSPKIKPFFSFIYELLDEDHPFYEHLRHKVSTSA